MTAVVVRRGLAFALLAIAVQAHPSIKNRALDSASHAQATFMAPVPRASVHADAVAHSAAANPRALKLTVERDGPIAITGAQLAEAGWPIAEVDPLSITLSESGLPVAIRHVPFVPAPSGIGRSAQESQSAHRSSHHIVAPLRSLDPKDRLEFIGRAHHDEYTDAAVYWLEPNGPTTRHLRFGVREATPLGVSATRSFTATVILETDSAYITAYRPEGGQRWLWGGPLAAGSSRHLDGLPITGSGTGARMSTDGGRAVWAHPGPLEGLATLRVFLQGHTDDPDVAADHHLSLSIDGAVIAETRFDGRARAILGATVNSKALVTEDDPPVLQSVGTGAIVDSVFLDRFEVDYPAALHADGRSLSFDLPAVDFDTGLDTDLETLDDSRTVPDVNITGFDEPEIVVVDSSDPQHPITLSNIKITRDEAGGFGARFAGRAEGGHYTAWATAGANAPSNIERGRDRMPALEGAYTTEHVIITHRDLAPAVTRLAEHRKAAGMRSIIVTTDDIYDLYSGGRYDPRAIGDFLQAARPTFALLVGEANLDHRGGYAEARSDPDPPMNRVPSLQVELQDGSVATSDLPYADFDGDGVPEVHIGRLPGSTVDDVANVIEKIIRFETEQPVAPPLDGDWRRRALFVADGTGAAVESVADGLSAALAPLAPDVEQLYAARVDPDVDIRSAIGASIDEGRLLVAYVGHGNVDTWAPWRGGGRLLRTADVLAMTNGLRLPLLLTATCMNGWFDHPLKADSLAEGWLADPDGGGVAAWSPTGLARLPGQSALLHEFLMRLVNEPSAPIGVLVSKAISTIVAADPSAADTARAYALIGDPATSLFAAESAHAIPGATRRPSSRAREFRLWLPLMLEQGNPQP